MFGETDIILKRERWESYTAKCDCYILKLDRIVFDQIRKEFPDFGDEIDNIAEERERKRLEFIQQKIMDDPAQDQKDL